MIITNLKVNHLTNPFGYDVKQPVFSFQVAESTGKHMKEARIRIATTESMENPVFDSGYSSDISSLAYAPEFLCEGGIRYYWDVSVVADNGDIGTSDVSRFEDGRKEKTWDIPWITAPFDQQTHPVFKKKFQTAEGKKVLQARLYMSGLGLYEAYLNGEKTGEEYLAPFYNDYRFWVQYQTYDITAQLQEGVNEIAASLGNGWYKGRFCYLNEGDNENIYGDHFQLSGELLITYEDGSEQRIQTDESWVCTESPVLFSNLYDGEIYDANIEINLQEELQEDLQENPDKVRHAVLIEAPKGTVTQRMSPPLVIHERISPVKLIRTPAGEQVLDFGQEITGWVEFDCDCPQGTKIHLQHGEILQQDNFYRDNLRSAKAEYTYISGGKPAHVRPHFTFYGFRYVKVEGIQLAEENLEHYNFEACAIYSDLDQTGKIETSDAKLNRLIENTLWGQKGNFLDVPTDCPQRDERLGWTGDAEVFCATASFHCDTAAFYRKFLKDMRLEQEINQGAVPYVVPDLLSTIREKAGEPAPDMTKSDWGEAGSCAWGDAATVIPWTMYQFYGDRNLLAEGYDNMKMWTDFIIHMDETYCQGRRLWQVGFHFADWLALDNPDPESCFGSTDPHYVASVYYLYSASMTAKAAAVLGYEKDAAYYEQIEREVRQAIRETYIDKDGRVKIETQTAAVLAIYFDLVSSEQMPRVVEQLMSMLKSNHMHLNTGFVGTAYLCKCLSKAGHTDAAYTLLFNEDYPSWLYEVNMGATTVWERWNSVLPDGSISGTGMNSLNHYAYGAVCEWIYQDVCGITPVEDAPGFKKVILAPKPDERLGWAYGEYMSAAGLYKSSWKMSGGHLSCEIEIPFDCEARFMAPDGFEIAEVKEIDFDSSEEEIRESAQKNPVTYSNGIKPAETTKITEHQFTAGVYQIKLIKR